MKIRDILQSGRVTVSFEAFPPKKDSAFASVQSAVDQMCALAPDFMSVTYGAGGGTSKNTVRIAQHVQNDLGVTALAHLTCASSTREQVSAMLDELHACGIENILALRGDIPKDAQFPLPNQYTYAYQLIEQIAARGDFCIGAACYPEGHTECEHKEDDITHLIQKVACGVDFLTTQMFFDNNILYNFLYRIRERGVTVPVIAGIMPITNRSYLTRAIELSGSFMPRRFVSLVDRFGDDPAAMKQAGIAYATDQIIDLYANGITCVHVYSMNKPDIAAEILGNLSAILGR